MSIAVPLVHDSSKVLNSLCLLDSAEVSWLRFISIGVLMHAHLLRGGAVLSPRQAFRLPEVDLNLVVIHNGSFYGTAGNLRFFDSNRADPLKEEDDLVQVGDIHSRDLRQLVDRFRLKGTNLREDPQITREPIEVLLVVERNLGVSPFELFLPDSCECLGEVAQNVC